MDVYAAVDAGFARPQVERRLRGAVARRVLHVGRRVATDPPVCGDGRGVDRLRELYVVTRASGALSLREVAARNYEITNLDPVPVIVRMKLKYGMSSRWQVQQLHLWSNGNRRVFEGVVRV